MYVDAPIPTAGLTDEDLPALMQAVSEAMSAHFEERVEVGEKGGEALR